MTILLLTLLLAGQPPGPGTAAGEQSSAGAYVGRTVVRADVSIEGDVNADRGLGVLIETPVGQPLSMTAVRETIAHLYSLGRFQEIVVEATDAEGGVAIRYDLVPLHSVQRIEFTGALGLPASALRRAVVEAFSATPAPARAASVAEMLQGFYFDRGYLGAAIRPVLEEVHGPDGTILTFEIQSGARASIRDVTVVGDPGQPRDAFLREIHADPGRIYQRVEVQAELARHLDRVRRAGRYEARGSHRIVTQSDDGRSVDLAVTVDLGPEVAIRFEGDPLPKDRIEELVPVRREGSIDADILEDAERRIVQYLNEQGYWKASASANRRTSDGRVEIVFTVDRGRQYRIARDGATVSGNTSIPTAELRPALENLQEGDPFTAAALDAAASAIRGIYLRRGYAGVKVAAAANELPPVKAGEGRIEPAINIIEGPVVRIGDVTFEGNASIPREELVRRVATAPGQAYYEPRVIQDRETILTEYLNRGFASATVAVVPTVTDSRVDLVFQIAEGPQSVVDHVLIVGNIRTDPRVIEREVQLTPGEPLGLEALFETRRRLGALGLFRRIRITEVQHGESARRDVLITVEEAPSTSIGYGGGLELRERLVTGADGTAEERYEVAPRGFFEVGRRNIGGKNRSANLYTRLSLRSDADRRTGSDDQFGFAEYRVVGTYREPRTFGWNADVTITAALEQGERTTFKFSRKGVNAELLRRLTSQVRTSARYTFATTRTFDEALTEEEQAAIDRIFPQVRLSAFSGTIVRDTRDDALDPTRGLFVSAEGTLAARALGGQVGFMKSFLQAQGYRRLPVGERVIFAARAALGLADGFQRQVEVIGSDGTPVLQTVEDLPASERYFAGGDTTLRGFALDSVGTTETITASGFPRGGNGLVLMNAELRVPVWKDFGAAFFVDAGNVFPRVTRIDLGDLRTSVGVGLRYRSPVGPLRFDVGFKTERRTVGGALESRRAYHFSFGQAF